MKKKKVRIRVSKNSLYLDYFFNSQRTREFLKLSNTEENYKIAEKIAIEKEEFLNKVQNKLEEWYVPKAKLTDDIVHIKVMSELTRKKMLFTLSDALEQFVKENPKKEKNLAVYNSAVKSFNDFAGADIHIKTIDNLLYNKYKEHILISKSYSTCRTYINYLRMLFDHLIKVHKYNSANPFLKIKDIQKQKIRIVTDNHWKIISSYLQEKNQTVFDFIYLLKMTGFRRDELLKQKWPDVLFDENILIVTTYKDNFREDIFPLNLNSGDLKKHLEDMYKRKSPDNENLFNFSEEYPRKYLQKCIKEINNDNETLKIPNYTLHDLRRTFCSYYAQKLTPSELMILSRHKKIETTMKYYVAIDVRQIAEKSNL